MADPSLQQKVVTYAQAKNGQQVGDGECFALADEALRSQGAKSAADYGTVTPTADYQWGKEVQLTAIQSGDVLQFRDYERTIQKSAEKKVLLPDGTPLTYSSSSTDVLKRPHHTAVANSVASSDSVSVLEQNVDRGSGKLEKTVANAAIALSTRSAVTTASTETVTINAAWGEEVKKVFSSPQDKQYIDEIVKKYGNQTINADVSTTVSTTVKGTVKAYRPEPK